jgi:hypothetical protein
MVEREVDVFKIITIEREYGSGAAAAQTVENRKIVDSLKVSPGFSSVVGNAG